VSAALETDLCGNLLVPVQGDVFQKQPDHAFAFPVGRSGITPQPGEVGRQRDDDGALLVRQNTRVLFTATLIFLVSLSQRSQLMVPVSLK